MIEFYVVSSGRCGTKWLQSIWGKDRSVSILHEPFGRLDTNLVSTDGAYFGGLRRPAARLISQMVEVSRGRDIRIMGETTPSLRYACESIRKAAPAARIIHLVRDGRDVVRSLMNRFHYRSGNHGGRAVEPSAGIWRKRWVNFSRFQRCCWYWLHTNEVVTSYDVRVRFEDLVGSFEAFEALTSWLGIATFEARWERMRAKKVNKSFRHGFPAWPEWTGEQARQFDVICGEQMEEFGYTSRQGATT